jgi:hypothetical protein
MQLDDRAEYGADKVREIFGVVLADEGRGQALFEHIRYRAGLLLERRAGVFAFAHLTFQEYLSAQAVHEGNRLGVNPETLAREHHDGRWKEVIALYCGLAPAPAARAMIKQLMAQDDSKEIAPVLAEAYFISGLEIHQDRDLRTRTLERLARAPLSPGHSVLDGFPEEEVAPVANSAIGTIQSNLKVSQAFTWLHRNPRYIDKARLRDRIFHRTVETPVQFCELVYLAFMSLGVKDLIRLADDPAVLASRGPFFTSDRYEYSSQALMAVFGMSRRARRYRPDAVRRVLPRVMDQLLSRRPKAQDIAYVAEPLTDFAEFDFAANDDSQREFAVRVARLIDAFEQHGGTASNIYGFHNISKMKKWLNSLENSFTDFATGEGPGRTSPPARRRSTRR